MKTVTTSEMAAEVGRERLLREGSVVLALMGLAGQEAGKTEVAVSSHHPRRSPPCRRDEVASR